jgi:hypothetical protein
MIRNTGRWFFRDVYRRNVHRRECHGDDVLANHSANRRLHRDVSLINHVWLDAIQAQKLLSHIRALKTALATRTR